jgi:tetratricopeptide (TPR) repeat protein
MTIALATETRVFNPFPGLRPFNIAEAHLFFGREGQSLDLLRLLRERRFVAVVGPSGSGKSSLVRAGLIPSLHGGFMRSAGSHWRIVVFRPGANPIGNLARELADPLALGSEKLDERDRREFMEITLRRGSLGLAEAVDEAHLAPNENLLVIVDQFEEIFRFQRVSVGTAYRDDAATFVKLLIEASRAGSATFVLLTMRSDYLGDCAQFRDLPECINRGQYLIPRMTRDERRAAITSPAAVGGGAIAPRLVSRILNDVGAEPDQLPILQHALMRAWDCWEHDHAEGEPLDLRHYEQVGGALAALSRHAEEAYGELDERGQELAAKVFRQLTERGPDNRDIRRPTRFADLCSIVAADARAVTAVLDPFRAAGRSFLMPPAEVSLEADTLIDISHESLIRGWERLQAWVAAETEAAKRFGRLRDTAALWEAHRAGLLTEPELDHMLEWWQRDAPTPAWSRVYGGDYDSASRFLRESADERAQALLREAVQVAAKRRRRLVTTGALVTGLVLMSVLALGAWLSSKHAREAEQTARTARTDALGQRDRAEQNFQAAGETADRLEELVGRYSQDMRVPTEALQLVIGIADSALGELAVTPDRRLRYARFLATAGNAHIRIARYDSALVLGRRAVAVLDSLGDSGFDRRTERLVRGEATYVIGASLLATGRIAEAQDALEDALARAADAHATDPSRATRLSVETTWQLANLAASRLDRPAQRRHARAIAAHADRAGPSVESGTANEWRALALMAEASSLIFDDDDRGTRLYERARGLVEKMRKNSPDNHRWTALHVEVDYARGMAETRVGRPEAARGHLEAGLELSRRLVSRDPANLEWRYHHAMVHRARGEMLTAVNDWPRAEDALDSAVALTEALTTLQPEWRRAQYQHMAVLNRAGDLALVRRQWSTTHRERFLPQATRFFQRSLTAAQHGSATAPLDLEFQRALSMAQHRIARVSELRGDGEQARAYAGAATRTIEQIAKAANGDAVVRMNAYIVFWTHAALLPDSTHRDTKLRLLDRSRTILEDLAAKRSDRELLVDLAKIHNAIGVLLESENIGRALHHYDRAMTALDSAIARFGADPDLLQMKGRFVHRNRAHVRLAQNDYDLALRELEAAVETGGSALKLSWGDSILARDLKVIAADAKSIADSVASKGAIDSVSTAVRARALAISARSDPSQYIPRKTLGDWSLPPLIPGAWRTLTDTELKAELDRFRRSAAASMVQHRRIERIRRLDLSFYDDGALFEADVLDAASASIIDYVRVGDDVFVLNGESAPIHEINSSAPLRVANIFQAAAYVRFFVAAIQGRGGRFSWADQLADLAWLPEASTAQRDSVHQLVWPLVVEADPSRIGWRATGSVVYDGDLFENTFRLYPDGMIVMLSDIPVRSSLPVGAERFDNGVRYRLDRRASALRDSLARRSRALFAADSFALAAAVGQERVDALRQVVGREATYSATVELARSLGSQSWYFLFARRPAQALEAAEEALRLAPTETWIQTNRAHALLLLGRTAEAEVVYREWRGRMIEGGTWESVVRTDVELLASKGMFSPAQAATVHGWLGP